MQESDEKPNLAYGWETNAFSSNEHVIISLNLLIFLILLITCLFVQYYVENRTRPETSVTDSVKNHLEKEGKSDKQTEQNYSSVSQSQFAPSSQPHEDSPEETSVPDSHQSQSLLQRMTMRVLPFLPASGITVLISALVGGGLCLVVGLSSNSPLSFAPPFSLGFNSNIFYFALLPPIIFQSGYHLRRRLFVRHMDAIFSLAFLGTCIATTITAIAIYYFTNQVVYMTSSTVSADGGGTVHAGFTWMESLAFGSLLSSTDPVSTLAIYNSLKVDPDLFYLVFGESVLNDAIAITLYRTTCRFVVLAASTIVQEDGAWTTVESIQHVEGLWVVLNFVVVFFGSLVIGYGTAIGLAYFLGCHDFTQNPHQDPPNEFQMEQQAKLSTEYRLSKGVPDNLYIDPANNSFPNNSAQWQSPLRHHTLNTQVGRTNMHTMMTLLCVVGCMIYVPFLLAEMLQLSGIVAIFFTGIATRRYIAKNIPLTVKLTATQLFEMLSYLSETACFVILGLSIFLIPFELYHFRLIIFITFIVLSSRAFQVYLLLFSTNVFRSWKRKRALALPTSPKSPSAANAVDPIPVNHMHMAVLAGLRGAVAYTLAYIFPNEHGHRELVIATTAIVILITIFFQGGLTEPTIKFLGIRTNVTSAENLDTIMDLTADDDLNRSDTFERKYIYRFVLRSHRYKNMNEMNFVDNSSGGGSMHGLDAVELSTFASPSAFKSPMWSESTHSVPRVLLSPDDSRRYRGATFSPSYPVTVQPKSSV